MPVGISLHKLFIMRRLISVLVLVTLAVGLVLAQDPNVRITGSLKMDTLYRTVYVENFDRRPTIIDSASINDKGQFYLEFQIKMLTFLKLKLDRENYLILIILPGEQINIATEASALAKDPVIEGSVHSERLQSLSHGIRQYESRLDSLHRLADLARTGDSADTEAQAALKEEYQRTIIGLKEYLQHFFDENPASPACLFYSDRLPLEEYLSTFSRLDDSLFTRYPDNPYVRELHYAVTSKSTIQPGLVAPNIVAPTPDGDSAALWDRRGNVILVDFWAAWCGPCRRENPTIVAMYNKYHDSGFEVFGVSLDESKENWLKAIRDDSLTWTQVSDLRKWESPSAMTYAVRSIPFSVLVDREGRIIARELRGSALRSKLEEIFGH